MDTFCHLLAAAHIALHIRQTADKAAAIPFFDNPTIQHTEHALVAIRTNQPAKSLLKADQRLRQAKITKRRASFCLNALHARRGKRIVRRPEGQPHYNNEGKRTAYHVHTFPETVRTQNAAALFPFQSCQQAVRFAADAMRQQKDTLLLQRPTDTLKYRF